MLASVTDLLKQGLPMLPSAGRNKGPCLPWKDFQTRVPTLEELRRWERKVKPDRWGFATGKLSGRIVIDFDGEAGIELMRKWGLKPHIRTGSGGYHCHLIHPGWHVPTLNARSAKKSWPWPGVDIRGDGGFAIVFGRNINGAYVQLRELDSDPFEVLPEDVRNFLWNHSPHRRVSANRGPFSGPRVDSWERVDVNRLICDSLDIARRDGRNNAGFWLACQLRDNGYDLAAAESAMRVFRSHAGPANTKGRQEPYTEHEMMASLREAYSRSAREPWVPKSPPHRNDSSDHKKGGKKVSSGAPLCANADGAGSMSLYVGHPSDPLVGQGGDPLSRTKYARIPPEVSSDRRLTKVDLRVYPVLAAACWQGSTASVGKRRISKLAPCAERLVAPSLRRLEAAGHIVKTPVKRGQRGIYHLQSQVFGQKQRAGVHEMIVALDGNRRLASVRKEPDIARTARG